MAHECPEHNGLHVFSDLFHVEVIHESGRHAESGETGEIVITDLSNLYMPFIRYRTGDQVVQGGTKCPCGRGFPLLERLEGRSPDDIVAPEGKVIDHIPSPAEGKEKVVISNMEERLVIKSKIHKAHINGEEPGENDCLRIDARLMELGNVSAYEKVLIVNATNGARLETFARKAPGGSGEITACGAVSKLCGPGDEEPGEIERHEGEHEAARHRQAQEREDQPPHRRAYVPAQRFDSTNNRPMSRRRCRRRKAAGPRRPGRRPE